jgi:hypothetical protein
MLVWLFILLALLCVTAAAHVAYGRRSERSSTLLSLGAVSTRWLISHRGEQQ